MFALYLILLTAALVDWARRRHPRYISRWLWLALILIFSCVGPAAYLLLGRAEEQGGR
jgi:hypothetical protein